MLYALLLVIAFFTALPSVVSASAKLADAVLTRFHPLQQAFDEVAAGERSVRVEEGGSREFRELARHFNRMLDNVRSVSSAPCGALRPARPSQRRPRGGTRGASRPPKQPRTAIRRTTTGAVGGRSATGPLVRPIRPPRWCS